VHHITTSPATELGFFMPAGQAEPTSGACDMTLKFKITKDEFEALEESHQALYAEDGDGYQLEVDGIDDGKELKEALRKEREERAAAKKRSQELETEKEQAERERLEQQQEWEQLARTERERADTRDKELSELRDKVANGERNMTAEGVVAGLIDKDATGGVQRYSLLRKEAMQFIAHTPEGVKINGPDGEAWDAKRLGVYLSEQYPFLVDGSKASGGGAPGSQGGGAVTKQFDKMSGMERVELRRNNPAEHQRLKAAHDAIN
jgi:anti-sigma28 factor (negative regulator of flagellin synthesis)